MPMNPPNEPEALKNKLLAALSRRELGDILPRLEACALEHGQTLIEANEPILYVYFPLSGIVSLVIATANGATVEIAMVGNEGIIGSPVLFGSGTAPIGAIVQVAGEALRIGAQAFRDQVESRGPLVRRLHLHAGALFFEAAQSVICMRHHSVGQRCARWLLTAHDRVGGDEFPLTQDALAQMLGVRRASVSEAAADLQDSGLIRYRRGFMTITDRAGLEQLSCECYRVISAEYERLLGG
jgi:CRP-like cAMP-binding protein